MDWFDAMQCCYYQVPRPPDWVFLYFFRSMVMSRNLWAKRNMTRSRSTSPSVCIFILSIFTWKYVGANQAERTQSSANGGDKQNAWWLGGTDLHSEVRSQIIHNFWYKSDYDTKSVDPTIVQGSWIWMSGAPWSFAPWGEGEWGHIVFFVRFPLENIRYFFYLYGFIFFCRWTQSEWEWGLHSDGPTKWGLWGELILFNQCWGWNFLKVKTTMRMRLWDWNTAEIIRDGKTWLENFKCF